MVAGMPSLLFVLATQARKQGDRKRAESLLRDALDSNDADRDARLGLATLLEEGGNLDEAAQHYGLLVAAEPANALAQASLGHVWARIGRHHQALDILRRAADADPSSASTLATLGAVLSEHGQAAEAIDILHRSIALDPVQADAHNHLGNAMHLLGRQREAIESYRQALKIKPDYASAHSNLIYTLSLDPDAGIEAHHAERAAWWLAFGAPYAEEAARPHSVDRGPDRALRVGYVSGHFRRESAAMSFMPILLAHDPKAVTWIGYSGTTQQDDVTERLKLAASEWCDTVGLDDAALAERIRADRIDILVDLAGHMYGNRLPVFARRPAPVQVSAWGEATGTGLRTMDALLSDPIHIPAAERPSYVEAIVDLPCHIHYARPATTPDIVTRPPGAAWVFGSLNRMAKLGEPTLALWRRVLEAVPAARLLLKDTAFSDAAARAFVTARLGHAERIEFRGASSHGEHLAAYNDIDVALDPTPQNGGVTTYEALWMGTPVVALAGRTPASRTSAAILTAAGCADWVASDAEHYVAIATGLIGDRPRLALASTGLPASLAASPLGDAKLYVSAVEARYRELWRAYLARR